MEQKLKLFVWHNCLRDYTDGVMFALAYNEEEAREVIRENGGRGMASVEQDLLATPTVYEEPVGHFVYGGG